MLTVKEIKLNDGLSWDSIIQGSSTATFFQTKEWLRLWVKHWGKDTRRLILAIYDGEDLVGIAPFQITDVINILGVPGPARPAALSDFGDIIVKPGREREVWEAVIKEVRKQKPESGIELNYIRGESPSFEILKELGGKAQDLDVSPVISLPLSWDDYLNSLGRHDRHELRRKMRRAGEEGIEFQSYTGKREEIDSLFRLMKTGNEQKINFLNSEMEGFFADMIDSLSAGKLLDLKFMVYEDKMIASIVTFLFKDEVLLYNSGFDPRFIRLSPGLMLKANSIKEAIENKQKTYDFLRGGEKYKFDLGGKERKLYKIRF